MSTQDPKIDRIAGQVLNIVRDSLPKAYNELTDEAAKRTTPAMPTAEAVLSQATADFVEGRIPHHTGIISDESTESMAEGIRGYLSKMEITSNASALAHLQNKTYGQSVHDGVGRVMINIKDDAAWRRVAESHITSRLKEALGTDVNLTIIQMALNEIVADLPEDKRSSYADKELDKIGQDISKKFIEMKSRLGNDLGQAM